ncbi:MAG: homogentisate 1,2-dioxygenase, partial [Acidimicrobiales bacterium]
MTYYWRVGDVPSKRHTLFRDGSGTRLAEELMGEEGFSGSSSLLYHRHSPSAITGIEEVDVKRSCLGPNHPLAPWHLRVPSLPAGGDMVADRQVLAGNSTVTIAWAAADSPSELYRNAAGDEVVYIQSGNAVMESVFGTLSVSAGDYVVIPTSTTHRWLPAGGEAVEALILESVGHVGVPARYRTATGQLREGAPYCERDLRPPEGPLVVPDEGSVPVLVRSRQGWSRHIHAHHPFDVVGWDGCNWPLAFSISDFEPIAGRIHQPPPVHQTFAGPGFVVCSFV